MSVLLRRSPVAALAALLMLPAASAEVAFSRLKAGAKCADYWIPEVASKQDCFDTASATLGLHPAMKIQIDGIGFNGCALNTVANVLIYSVTPAATPATHIALPTLQYVCNGVATTTVTATTSATTHTTTTTSGIFAKLGPGSRCSDEGVPDVPSKEACFDAAQHLVGLGGVAAMELNNIGFTGCVFNSAANIVMYGVTAGLTSNMKLPTFEYVCSGIPTTTTTTTATVTTTTVVYARLAAGRRCAEHSLPDVSSSSACFGAAAAAAGLGGKMTIAVDFMGFTGCVYNSVAGILMYGVTPGVTPATTMALPNFEYICDGVAPPLYP